TLLDVAKAAGREMRAIGKIGDIYAHSGPTKEIKADGNAALMTSTMEALAQAPDGAFVMTNFVDFDSLYGHRRDVPGYARALAEFDATLPAFRAAMKPGDIAVLTADHGCDPTFKGTDHTREHIPVLWFGPGIAGKDIGIRSSFADIGQSIAAHLGLKPLAHGKSFV
ncbi:MAG: phosphopentomutase, partial [Proteobacteria bacterium]|nr:phosphopentomutase [Pseudomonadota bacterium]